MELTELQEQWLRALESGEYQQGREQLEISAEKISRRQIDAREWGDPEDRSDNEPPSYILVLDDSRPAYCCMGVMCALARKIDEFFTYDPSSGYPPLNILEMFRLVDNQMAYVDVEEQMSKQETVVLEGTAGLALLNDWKEFDFAQIAAEVRAHPERYFQAPDATSGH